MELLLTQATVAIELLGFGYMASSFALYTHHRLNQSTWRSRSTFTPVEDVPENTTAKRKQTPVERLRQQCQQAGIKWRNAHGKNKHLKKAEMIAALQQLEQAKRSSAAQQDPSKRMTPRKRVA